MAVPVHIRDDVQGTLPARVDRFIPSLSTIDITQYLAHEGLIFNVGYFIAGLTQGSTYDALLQVPTGVFPHMRLGQFTASQTPFDLLFYEDSVVSANGAPLTAFNKNMSSPLAMSASFLTLKD